MSAEDESVLTRSAAGPDLTVRYGPDQEQLVDLWPGGARAAGRPLAVMLHGGFWRPAYDRVHTRPLATALREAGWSTASVEYRRRPGSPETTVQDVAAALAALPGLVPGGSSNGTVVVLGHSAGGHLALWSAVAAPAPGLVGTIALAPASDLRLAERLGLGGGAVEAFLGGPAEAFGALDPARLPAPASAVTVLHGTEDAVVPLAVSDSYAAAHPGTGLTALPETGHFALIDPLSAAWPTVVETLRGFGG